MKISQASAVAEQDEHEIPVTIYDKAGEPFTASDGSICTITVVGAEAKRVKKVRASQTKRLIRLQRAQFDDVDVKANRVEAAAAAVTAWHGWEDDAGNPAACTPENVQALLGATDHILEQVESAIARHGSFFANKPRG